MRPLRAPAIGAMKRLTATTGSLRLQHSSYAAHIHTVSATWMIRDESGSRPPARFLSTTALLGTAHDSSTIDSVHTPTAKHETPPLPEITRIPLLPDNDSPHPGREGPDEGVIRPVIRPEISTVSGDGTHLDVPSAMSEVTDNHAAELDPYDLTSKVAVAASKATTKVEEPGWVKTLWTGLLDDIFGKRKSSKA